MTTARWTVAGFAILVVCLGATATVWPDSLVGFAETFLTTRGLWIAVALRLAVGALLWITAPTARTPMVFRVFGVLFVLSGVVLPFLGLDFLRGMVEWGTSLGDPALRGMGILVAAFGAFFFWSVTPRRSES